MRPYFRLLVLAGGLISLASPLSVAQQNAQRTRNAKTAEEFYQRGRYLAEQKKFRTAIESYKAAIDLDPNHPRAYVGRGDVKFELEDYGEAVEDYGKAISIYSSWNPKPADGTGNITLQDLIVQGEKSMQAGSGIGSIYLKRGLAKDSLGDTVGSCKDFREYCRWEKVECGSFPGCNEPARQRATREVPKAQGQSVSSGLEGTRWQAIHLGEVYSPLLERSLSRQFFCSFGNHGKVSCRVFGTASSKMTYERKYDSIRGRVEPKPVLLPPYTLPEENRVGTYKQNGNSIHIELSAYEIDATVQANSMAGNITFKLESKQRARWVAKRITEENSSSSLPVESPEDPVSKSEERQITPATIGSSDLKLGTYTITAKQSFNSYGVMVEENTIVKLRIESIDRSGEVKARLSLGNQEGQLRGRVNEEGMLELKGLLTWSQTIAASKFTLESRFTIRATVGDSKLINGIYLMVSTSNSSETKGVFKIGYWQEDF